MLVRKRLRDAETATGGADTGISDEPLAMQVDNSVASSEPSAISHSDYEKGGRNELLDDLLYEDIVMNEFMMNHSSFEFANESVASSNDVDDDIPMELINAGRSLGLEFEIGPVVLDYSSESDLLSTVYSAAAGIEGHLQAHIPVDGGSVTDSLLSPGNTHAKRTKVNYLPGVYRRCCKVWIKLANMSSAKNFMWEVDKEAFPDYYEVVKTPLSLSAVAYKLADMTYGRPALRGKISADGTMERNRESMMFVEKVGLAFYKDIRQICMNCITYNSEFTPMVAQAQKLLHVVQRHVIRWVLFSSGRNKDLHIARPLIDACDDDHCMLTSAVIPPFRSGFGSGATSMSAITCGRCSGTFSIDELQKSFNSDTETAVTTSEAVMTDANESAGSASAEIKDSASDKCNGEHPFAAYFVQPTDELISQTSEEWVCMFCLSEDTFLLRENCQLRGERNGYIIDEWGASALLPWSLHPSQSQIASVFHDSRPVDGSCGYISSADIVESNNTFKLKSRSSKLSDVSNSGESRGLPPQVLVLQKAALVLCDTTKSPILPQFDVDPRATANDPTSLNPRSCGIDLNLWSLSDRLTGLRGLCELVRLNPDAHEYMNNLHHECEKLVKMSSPHAGSSNIPAEAAFIAQCRAVAGDDAVLLFRKIMDGMNVGQRSGQVEGEGDEYVQRIVASGKCYVCKGSTFIEDVSDDLILLCDGCNVEAHLKCLDLDGVISRTFLLFFFLCVQWSVVCGLILTCVTPLFVYVCRSPLANGTARLVSREWRHEVKPEDR